MRTGKISAFTRRDTLQYIIALAAPIGVICLLLLLAEGICGLRIWYANDNVYQFLKYIQMRSPLIVAIFTLAADIVVTYLFMRRIMRRYVSEMTEAAKIIAENSEQTIMLSPALSEAEYELNTARQTALRNAMLAAESEQRRHDMIMYLAHDLKTPLTSVIGYLTLLRDEPDISEENRLKYTSIALDRAERLGRLTDEFFDITRFSLAKQELNLSRIDLVFMLKQIVSEFEVIMNQHGLNVITDVPEAVFLLCDPDKLERVFDNILRNAVNYSYPDTAILLTVGTDDSLVRISVKNRGRTIPQEKLERLFEQFFRADAARQSETGGAGLGLAIAREIVRLHGGEITAFSENESVEFLIRLPIK